MHKLLLLLTAMVLGSLGYCQGLEDIIVETYYVSDANDATDTDGGSLPEGSVTYRVYVDMAPGYALETIFGSDIHEMFYRTTTEWFNNEDRGETFGPDLGANRLDENTVALDSYITMGGASDTHIGVLKSDDTDGSLVGGANNDGGSEGIPSGLLTNNDESAGIPLTVADGLQESSAPSITVIGLDAGMFNDENSAQEFYSTNGAYAVLGGYTSSDAQNRVLVGQFTTDGEFSFELNLRIQSATGQIEQYVAKDPGVTLDDVVEQVNDGLTFSSEDGAEGVARLSRVDTDNSTTIITNFGEADIDISSYWLCNFPAYQSLSTATIVSGDLDLAPGDQVVVSWGSISGVDGELAIYSTNTFADSNAILDYMQWGEADHQRESVAVSAGIWGAGEFLASASPYQFVGGAQDFGLAFWTGEEVFPGCTDPSACNFDQSATQDDGSCIIVEAAAIATQDATEICVGDGVADPIAVVVTGGQGPAGTFVVTDESLMILALPEGPVIDLEGAEPGVCLIWYLNLDPNDIGGATIGASAADLSGCFALSNSISVQRNGGGCTDETAINFMADACFDDGSCEFDQIPGCTDPLACNFSLEAEIDDGSCIIVAPATISTLSMTEVCVGDGAEDIVEVDVVGGQGPNSTLVVTDESLEILAIPSGTTIDFEGVTTGTCLIWHLNFDADDISGATVGANAAQLSGCFILSNSIEIVRNGGGCTDAFALNFDDTACFEDGSCIFDEVFGCTDPQACNFDIEAGIDDGSCIVVLPSSISTGDDTEICSGDGVSDPIQVAVEGGQGPASSFVVTDDELNILAFQEGSLFDLEGAGAGTCLIWNVNFDPNDFTGNMIGANAADLGGCFELSNAITVVRSGGGCTDPESVNFDPSACFDDGSCEDDIVFGCTDESACNFNPAATNNDESCVYAIAAQISTEDATEICSGDGVADPITVTVNGGQGPSSAFVITETDLTILDIASGPTFDLEAAGAGTCLIWHINFDSSDLEGATVGANAADLSGCFALSNAITVVRSGGGCTDPDSDNYDETACFDDGSCETTGVSGCTDEAACNYDPLATEDDGSCVVVEAAMISTEDETEICVGDGEPDPIAVTLTGGQGPDAAFVITDLDLEILSIVEGPVFDLEGAGPGVCLIWHLSFDASDVTGAQLGANAADLGGCFALSNSITVVRSGGGCTDPSAENYDEDACFDDGSCIVSDCTTDILMSTVAGWQATTYVWGEEDTGVIESIESTESVVPVSGGGAGVTTPGSFIDGRYFIGLNGHFHGDFSGPGYDENTNWADWGTYSSALPASNVQDMFGLSGSGDQTVLAFRWIAFLDTDGDGEFSEADTYLGPISEDMMLPVEVSGRLYIGFADRPGQFGNNQGEVLFTHCNSPSDTDEESMTQEVSEALTKRLEAEGFRFALYPNPNNGQFQISTDVDVRKVIIRDATGKVVSRPGVRGLGELTIDASDLSEGIYIVEVHSEKMVSSSRLVITN